MNRVRSICRLLTGAPRRAGALLASTAAAPAVLAADPPLPPSWNKHPPLPGPAHVRVALTGGMPGWQVALIAAGAAVLAVTLAVPLARVQAARRRAAAHRPAWRRPRWPCRTVHPGRDGCRERGGRPSAQPARSPESPAAGAGQFTPIGCVRRRTGRTELARSHCHDVPAPRGDRARPAVAHRPAMHPPPAKPGRILGQPPRRPDGAPAMVPVLLPRTGPRPLRRDPLRWLKTRERAQGRAL